MVSGCATNPENSRYKYMGPLIEFHNKPHVATIVIFTDNIWTICKVMRSHKGDRYACIP